MNGLNLTMYKQSIVIPTLKLMANVNPRLYSDTAVNLMTGIALVESGMVYLNQLNDGPAIGLDEMEPATLADQYNTFLDYPANDTLKAIINGMTISAMSLADQLHGNLYLGCALARIKLWRAKPPLPAASDAAGMAQYHKDWYNSALGKADVATNTPLFQDAINA